MIDVKKQITFYLMKFSQTDFSSNTLYNYKSIITRFLIHFENKANLSDITFEEIKHYIESSSTLNSKFTRMNAIKSFYYLTGNNSIDLSCFNKTKRAKQKRKETREIDILKILRPSMLHGEYSIEIKK